MDTFKINIACKSTGLTDELNVGWWKTSSQGQWLEHWFE